MILTVIPFPDDHYKYSSALDIAPPSVSEISASEIFLDLAYSLPNILRSFRVALSEASTKTLPKTCHQPPRLTATRERPLGWRC